MIFYGVCRNKQFSAISGLERPSVIIFRRNKIRNVYYYFNDERWFFKKYEDYKKIIFYK